MNILYFLILIFIFIFIFVFRQVNESLKFLNFPKKSKIPTWLREIILSSSEDHLRKFLVFVTGSPSITPTTYQKIEINVRCQARSGSLPVAHTCFYHLGKHDSFIIDDRNNALIHSLYTFSFFYFRYTRLPWQRDIAGETDVCNRPCEHVWNRLIRLLLFLKPLLLDLINYHLVSTCFPCTFICLFTNFLRLRIYLRAGASLKIKNQFNRIEIGLRAII